VISYTNDKFIEEVDKMFNRSADRNCIYLTKWQWGWFVRQILKYNKRIEELNNELSALRTKWDELPAFLVKQDEADIFDEHNLNMLLIEYLLDIKPEKK